MKLVKVIKNGQVVQPAKFDNDTDMNAWIQMLADTGAWGLPERWTKDATEEQKAMALETRTVELMGEQVVEYRLPSEYEVVIENISAQVEQERINQEALAFLNATDFKVLRHRDQVDAGLPTSLSAEEYAQLLAERQAARDRVVR